MRRTTLHCVKTSEPDHLGRCELLVLWWGYNPSLDCYGINGQVAFAEPDTVGSGRPVVWHETEEQARAAVSAEGGGS